MNRTPIATTILAVTASACSPHSLAEAVMKREDEFPRNSVVLIPPSDVDRLGQTLEQLGDRRGRPTGQRCFDVAPVTGHGLSRIELAYKAAQRSRPRAKNWPLRLVAS